MVLEIASLVDFCPLLLKERALTSALLLVTTALVLSSREAASLSPMLLIFRFLLIKQHPRM
jgi:hypothetical protein